MKSDIKYRKSTKKELRALERDRGNEIKAISLRKKMKRLKKRKTHRIRSPYSFSFFNFAASPEEIISEQNKSRKDINNKRKEKKKNFHRKLEQNKLQSLWHNMFSHTKACYCNSDLESKTYMCSVWFLRFSHIPSFEPRFFFSAKSLEAQRKTRIIQMNPRKRLKIIRFIIVKQFINMEHLYFTWRERNARKEKKNNFSFVKKSANASSIWNETHTSRCVHHISTNLRMAKIFARKSWLKYTRAQSNLNSCGVFVSEI